MVVAYINCAKVPVFIDKEVDGVNGVENGCDYNGLCDEAVELVLVGQERKIAADSSTTTEETSE
jgi:hypothetical protein